MMKATVKVRIEQPTSSAKMTTAPVGILRRMKASISAPVFAKGVPAVVDQAVVSGTSFVTTVLIGRMGSQAELGVFYLALSIVMVARGIHVELVSSPYTIYSSHRKGNRLAMYSGSSLVHHLALTAVSLACLAIVVALISTGTSVTGTRFVLWILIGALPLLLLREFIRQFSFAHLRPATALIIDSVVAMLQLGSLVLLAWLDLLSVGATYIVMSMSCGFACFAWVFVKQQRFVFRRSEFVTDWRQNWSFGKWALAGYLVGSTTPYILPWLVTHAHGEAATGMLAACCALVGLSNMFVTGLSNYLTPKAARAFARGGVDELQNVLVKVGTIYLLVLGIFCVLFTVAGGRMIVLVYGQQYGGGGLVISLLALGVLAQAVGITAGNGLWALDRPRANFAADVATLAVTLLLAVLLITPWGVLGAAVATLVGMTSAAVVRCVTLIRLMEASRWEPGIA